MMCHQANIWPTSNAADGERETVHIGRNHSLPSRAKMWPTVNTSESAKSGSSSAQAEKVLLGGFAAAWPTPISNYGGSGRRSGERSEEVLLNGAAERWPTVTAKERTDTKKERGKNLTPTKLGESIQQWPTIVSSDGEKMPQAHGTGDPAITGAAQSFPQPLMTGELGKQLHAMGTRFRLNPAFAEWLMGLPQGWLFREANGCG